MAYITARAVTNGAGYTISGYVENCGELKTIDVYGKGKKSIWEETVSDWHLTTLNTLQHNVNAPTHVLARNGVRWLRKYSMLCSYLIRKGHDEHKDIMIAKPSHKTKAIKIGNKEFRSRGCKIYER